MATPRIARPGPRRRGPLAQGDATHMPTQPSQSARRVANGSHETSPARRGRGQLAQGDGVTALVGTRQSMPNGEKAAVSDLRYRLGR
ncbi:hypothetical protein [Parafrankia discariae]|uniref:hypothetical protein n=1 Tax=Parafrankia discariae TaxID=365528 RepID=UPI000378519F|nr:hypothetical protein [Parafrankia discariae]